MIYKNFWNLTVTYGIGVILLRGISFLLLPLYTNLLSPEDAGKTFIFITFLAFMNALFSMGMDSSLLKYYNQKHSISTSLISLGFLITPLFLIMYLMSDVLSEMLFSDSLNSQWIFFSMIILSLDALSSRLITVLRILKMPFYYLFVCLVNVIASLLLNIYFLHTLHLSFMGVVFAMAGESIIQCLSITPVLFKFPVNFKFDFRLLKKMFLFAWPFFPATIFFIIIELSDRFMIQYFLGLDDVGLYGAGYKMAALILILIRAFNLNWQPYYLESGEKDIEQAKIQFANIGNFTIVGLIFLGTLLSSLYPLLLKINWNGFSIIGPEFFDGGKVIPWVTAGYIFYSFFILQMPSIYLKNKQKWAPFFWGTSALTNIFLNIILIPKLGFIGAAISTMVSYMTMAFLIYYKNRTWMPIKYNFKFLFFTLLASTLIFFIISLCNHNIIITFGLTIIYSIIILYILFNLKNKLVN